MTLPAPHRPGKVWAPLRASLAAGWIGQGLLLLVGVALAFLVARRVRLGVVRVAALLLGPLSVTLIVVTTAMAVHSS